MKQALFKIKGMQRDLTESSFNAELAYENYNIRLSSNETTSVLSILNEKGTGMVKFWDHAYDPSLSHSIAQGKVCGCCTLGDYIILFVWKSSTRLSIIRISVLGNNYFEFLYETLFSGNLNIPENTFVETLVDYENEEVQKVYWTDGVNLPRVINIVADDSTRATWDSNSFDFTLDLTGKETVTVTKKLYGGNFPSGVIQYVCTYSKKNALETALFYISPLLYLTQNYKGVDADSGSSNSFSITINNIDSRFDYINIYSIIRTSLNGEAESRLVVLKSISSISGDSYTFTDNGTNQTAVDSSELFYKGGTAISCLTFNLKDGTLFLGNLELLNNVTSISEDVQTIINNNTFSLSTGTLDRYLEESSYNNNFYENNFQLNAGSESGIKHFKFLETYRFGFLLQFEDGEWTDPIFIGDYLIDFAQSSDTFKYPKIDLNNTIYSLLVSLGFIKIRPLVVFPDDSNREFLCLGVLCPTVYNISDRKSNSPFALPSWFYRPIYLLSYSYGEDDLPGVGGMVPVLNGHNIALNMPLMLTENSVYPDDTVYNTWEKKLFEMPEYPILQGTRDHSGLEDWGLALYYVAYAEAGQYGDELSFDFYDSAVWYIDNSIVTLNSPDIEYDDNFANIDISNARFRIMGIAPLKAQYTNFYVEIDDLLNQTNTTGNSYSSEYYAPDINLTINGGYEDSARRGICGKGIAAIYTPEKKSDDVPETLLFSFIPPWSIQGTATPILTSVDNDYNTLAANKTSNLFYCSDTIYTNGINFNPVDISDIRLFNSEEITGISLQLPDHEPTQSLIYYGNIDKLITFPSATGLFGNDDADFYIRVIPFPTNLQVLNESGKAEDLIETLTLTRIEEIYQDDKSIAEYCGGLATSYNLVMPMTYKSTPHAVIVLNTDTDDSTSRDVQRPLPWSGSIKGSTIEFLSNDRTLNDSSYYFWDKERLIDGYIPHSFNFDISEALSKDSDLANMQGVLLIGELYREIEDKFGDTDRDSLSQLSWELAGPDIYLDPSLSSITLEYLYGDTFYQRYDSLKTYELSEDDLNSIYEVASVMVETKLNLQGRYDNRLGLYSFIGQNPSTFTTMNTVYNQKNNFFTYNVINTVNDVTKFANTVTWTTTKSAGSMTDAWTNVTMASTLDLDGVSGELRKIQRFNNELYTFLDRGISQILYNSRTQLTTTEGIPIEIANSAKVDGKRYLTRFIGCKNKHSIQETPNGLYFIDSFNKDIYKFTGEFKNISDELGMRSWVNSVDTEEIFTLYDADTKDVYFVNDANCLAYSERLGLFTSFYQYEGINNLVNVHNNSYTIANSAAGGDSLYLWQYRAGDLFFNVDSNGSYTTLIVSQNSTTDKTFTNIEFRGLGLNNNNEEVCPFTNIDVWNDYLEGTDKLVDKPMFPSNLKLKFRIWRGHIPRESGNILNRIRSPWAYVKLSSLILEDEGIPRDIKVQDIVVGYIE